jgi:hypothetical protein
MDNSVHLATVFEAVRALDQFDRDERIDADLDRLDRLQRVVSSARSASGQTPISGPHDEAASR